MAKPLPPRDSISGTFPNPSNAVARAAFGEVWDYLDGNFGADGTPEQARGKLGIGSISFRSKLINGRFAINQDSRSGTVTLAAGVYGHDGWKAGAGGCTYTFAKVGSLTTINISSGTLVQVADGRDIDGGNYVLRWVGTAPGRIGAGSYASNVVTASGVTAAANLSVEFGIGTLTSVQLEVGALPSIYESWPEYVDLVRCRAYYRTTYIGAAPGTAGAALGRKTILSASTSAYAQFDITFDPPMVATPAFTFYNPSTGTAGEMRNESIGANYAVSPVGSTNVSKNGTVVQASSAPPASNTISLHYTADARL